MFKFNDIFLVIVGGYEMCIRDRYCTWLFDILFELENRIDISSYNTYESRVFGFMAERLFNVWLEKQDIKKHELPVVFLENINWITKGSRFLMRKFVGK